MESFTEDLGELLGSSSGIGTKDERRLLKQEHAEVLVLGNSLLNVVGDGEESEPVADELARVVRVALNKSGLVLNDLADRGNGVVARMMVHSQLLLFALDLRRKGKLDTVFERGQAQVRAQLEGVAGVLSNDTDAVG